jgi:hypothetical protein
MLIGSSKNFRVCNRLNILNEQTLKTNAGSMDTFPAVGLSDRIQFKKNSNPFNARHISDDDFVQFFKLF